MNTNSEKDKETEQKEKEKAEEDKEILEAIKKATSHSLIQKLVYLNKLNEDKEELTEKEYNVEQKTLKNKYAVQYQAIYQEINGIVTGLSTYSISAEEKKGYQILEDSETACLPNNSPIEDYWTKVIINAKYFDMNENDKKALKHLKNVVMIPKENSQDFSVEFTFEKNDYFEQLILTKSYTFNKDGSVKSAVGTEITWASQDTNPTVKKKQVKVKKGKSVTKKTSYEKVESFFNFFNDKEKDDVSFLEDEVQFFEEDLFANQLEYYLDIMDIEDDFDDEDEDEDDDDDDDDDDEDEKPAKKGKQAKGHKKGKKGGNEKKEEGASTDKNAECKQQ